MRTNHYKQQTPTLSTIVLSANTALFNAPYAPLTNPLEMAKLQFKQFYKKTVRKYYALKARVTETFIDISQPEAISDATLLLEQYLNK